MKQLIDGLTLQVESEKNIGSIIPCSFIRVLFGMNSTLPVDYIPYGMVFLSEDEFNERFDEIEKLFGSSLGKNSFDFLKVTKRMVFTKYM